MTEDLLITDDVKRAYEAMTGIALDNDIQFGIDEEGLPHFCASSGLGEHRTDAVCPCNPDWLHDDTPGDPGWWQHH